MGVYPDVKTRKTNHSESHREYLRNRMKTIATTHGHKSGRRASGEYTSWQQMRSRCGIGSSQRWDSVYYIEKGITVCESWAGSFEAFLADMGLKPSPSHSLDRINGELGYFPGNCRWATKTEQARNRKNNHLLTANGQTKTLAEWCELTGISKSSVRDRLKARWCEECAVTTSPNGSKCPHREIQRMPRS